MGPKLFIFGGNYVKKIIFREHKKPINIEY